MTVAVSQCFSCSASSYASYILQLRNQFIHVHLPIQSKVVVVPEAQEVDRNQCIGGGGWSPPAFQHEGGKTDAAGRS